MLTILASDWNELIRDLEDLASDFRVDTTIDLIEGKRDKVLERLGRIAKSCSKLGLKFSASYAGEIAAYVTQGISLQDYGLATKANVAVLDPNKFKNEVSILRKRIDDELSEREFFALESKFTEYFQKIKLFGEQVFNSFPSANDDIYEAGTCLALARATACVMHLMRAVEVSLTVLTKELGLPQRHDWGKHLTDIENELTKRYKASGSRTPDETFFAEAAAQIGHIKTAWRNPTMHVDRSYTEERAEEIFVAVRSLLRHLAGKLHE